MKDEILAIQVYLVGDDIKMNYLYVECGDVDCIIWLTILPCGVSVKEMFRH